MRTALVILCRKQQAYADVIARGVAAQTVRPDRVLVMMDRPAHDEELAMATAYSGIPGCEFMKVESQPVDMGRPPMNAGVEPFCAGHCRDAAIDALPDADYIIFIDGDCIPMARMVESHIAAAKPGPVVVVGRRAECKWGSCDQRQVSSEHPIPIFGPTPIEVTDERYIVDSGVVWTCNFGISRDAINRLRRLNSELYGYSLVFHPDFCGRWGGEDGFVGMECFYTGIPIITAPVMDGDGVCHIEHTRPLDRYDHVNFMLFLEEKRRELIQLLRASGYSCIFRPHAEMVS